MLEWIISSTVLILIVVALRFILKGKISLRLQYTLWAIVLLRLIIPVSFGTSRLSVMNAVEKSEPYSNVIASLDASELPYGTLKDTALSQNEAEDTHGGTVYKIQGHSVESGTSDLHTYFFKAPARTVINKVLSVLWLSGTAATALCFILSNAVFFIRLRKRRVFVETALPQLPVYVTEAVDTPCLFGYFRPAIYITPGSCADETRMRHIIAHELTHYRHFDHIWSLLRGVCLALHWYNPLVWRAAVLSRNDAELACDEATIRRIGENERAEYGRTLIEMTCQKRPALLLTATTMTGSTNSIKERITMIAKKPKTAIYTFIAVILIAAVAAGCTFTGASKHTPWAWVRELKISDIKSVTVLDSENKLSDDEIKQLVSLMNALEKNDFTENKKLAGITPTYGLIIETSSEKYHLNEASSPNGNLEINYGEKQWWINNDDLSSFVIKATSAESKEGDDITGQENEIGETFSPVDSIDSLFASGDVALTLNLANDGTYNTYPANEWYSGRFKVLLSGYVWTELEMPLTEPSDFWLTAASADGVKSMTFWANSGAGMVQYNDGNITTYWSASPANEYSKSIAEDVRHEYDNLDVDYSRIVFYFDGSAEAAADSFVHSAYGSHMMSLAPGNMYGMSEYDVVQWGVREISENGDAVTDQKIFLLIDLGAGGHGLPAML